MVEVVKFVTGASVASASATVQTEGTLAAQSAKVYQAVLQSGEGIKSTILPMRRRAQQDEAALVLLMNVGTVSGLDDFKLHGPQLEVGNCDKSGQSKPVFIAVKNDGWYGKADYVLQLTKATCSNCTGVVCPTNMQCSERSSE